MQTRDFGWFRITETHYDPNAVVRTQARHPPVLFLPPHGALDLEVGRRLVHCDQTVVFLNQDVPHADRTGPDGSDSVSIELRKGRARLCARTLPRVVIGEPHTGCIAADIERELARADDTSAIAIEGLTLEMVASILRTGRGDHDDAKPAWLTRIERRIDGSYLQDVRRDDLAAEAGVSPDHLARVFRRHHRCSVGEYVRRLRVEWAAAQLRNTKSPISEVALAAGFCDQAHFCRWFKRLMGAAPGEYRAGRS